MDLTFKVVIKGDNFVDSINVTESNTWILFVAVVKKNR